MTGTVKWFSAERGYGFIIGDDRKELYVHRTAIIAGPDDDAVLTKNERVEFDAAPGHPFSAAVNVRRLM